VLFRLPEDIATNLILEVPDLQLVSRDQFPFDDPLAINPYAICASNVTYDKIIMNLSDTAMAARDFLGIQLHVTLLVPAEKQDRLVDQDAGAVG
jgi:hypothetical protein